MGQTSSLQIKLTKSYIQPRELREKSDLIEVYDIYSHTIQEFPNYYILKKNKKQRIHKNIMNIIEQSILKCKPIEMWIHPHNKNIYKVQNYIIIDYDSTDSEGNIYVNKPHKITTIATIPTIATTSV